MKALGRYDTALQMFVEEPHDVDTKRLAFLRWLLEHDRMDDGEIVGAPTGQLVIDPQRETVGLM